MRGRYIVIAVLFWAVAARAEQHSNANANSQNGQNNGQNYQGNGMALGGSGGGVSGGGGPGASYQTRSDPNATAKFGEQSQKAIADLNKANVSFAKDSSANLQNLLKSSEIPEAGGDFVKNGYDAIAAKTTPDLTKDADSIVNPIEADNAILVQNTLMMKNALIAPAPKAAAPAAAIPSVGDTIAKFTSTRAVGSISGSGLGSGTAAEMPSSRVHTLAAIPQSSGVSRGVTGNATVQDAPSTNIMNTSGVYNAPSGMRMPASVH